MKRLLVTLIIGLCLFSSCNENEWNESVLQTFELISVQFTPTDEPMEEIFGEPNVTTFENKSDKEKPFPDFIIASPILKFKPIVRFNQIRNFFFLFG